MNVQEYIDSGLLELYAAGGLTEAERAEVEAMAMRNPGVRSALDHALRTMEAYALTHAQAPPAHLEEKVLSRLQQDSPEGVKPSSAVMPDHQVSPITSMQSRPRPSKLNQRLKWAAVILLAVSAFTNFSLYRRLQEKEQELLATRQTVRQYAYQVSQLEQKAFQTENLMTFLRDPRTVSLPLKSVQANLAVSATVYWNQQNNEVVLDPASLPVAPDNKQYQLWAILDGVPIDAGLVQSQDRLQRMKATPMAQAFAITLEPKGGSATPTLEEMVVMGNI